MPEETKDVSNVVSSATPKEEVDERGVSLTNRIKELERKLRDAQTRLEAYNEEAENKPEPPAPVNKEANSDQNEVYKFVENPKSYISNVLLEHRFQEEASVAEEWLKSRPGYTDEDEVELYRIMQEHGMTNSRMLPMQRAKSAWEILEARKIKNKQNKVVEEETRLEKIKSTSLEGSGRVVPVKTGMTKQEVLKKFAEAESKSDYDEAMRLNELLENMSYQERKS